ncbi:amidase signature domain-containing protein [Lipomyces doorenjongii]|uniref:amidase signature domain-containing protein n=1 Tax=Lipomyces doorenjongii TaxID=383834 RepID=UPI0034CEB818
MSMFQHADILLKEAKTCLSNISSLNHRLNALISVRPPESVLTRVSEVALKCTESQSGLAGKLFAFKDNFCTIDQPTTCASKMLQGYVSPFEATVMTRLYKIAHAIDVGRANMDEFAMGTDNIFSVYGPPLNPLYSTPRSAGGSSGGSACAVAAGMCHFALGTDTGGSVRLPAAYCGVVGFKPSYGLVSRHGVVAFAQSLDTVGVLARDVQTVREVFNVISAYDPLDPTSVSNELRRQLQTNTARRRQASKGKYKLGIPLEFIVDSCSPDITNAWAAVLKKLLAQGHELYAVSMPSIKSALPTYYILGPSEAASNLSRYDGVRYGYRANVDRVANGVLYGVTRSEGFGSEVRRRILLGNYNLSSGAFNNHYIQAQKVRRKLQLNFDGVFSVDHPLEKPIDRDDQLTVDFLVAPCSTGTAPLLSDILSQKSPLDSYVNDVLTVPASLAGIPAISIPWHTDDGKVVGIQVMGQYGDDDRVLDVSETIMSL